MATVSQTHAEKAQAIARMIPVLRQFGIHRASLFGSFARGDNGPTSDIDLLIKAPSGATLFFLARLGAALEEAVGRTVDIITFKALEESNRPRLRERIMGDMEPLTI